MQHALQVAQATSVSAHQDIFCCCHLLFAGCEVWLSL